MVEAMEVGMGEVPVGTKQLLDVVRVRLEGRRREFSAAAARWASAGSGGLSGEEVAYRLERELECRDAARNVSIAITALEDAQMRWTRAEMKGLGIFNEADPESPAVLERAREHFEVNAPGNVSGVARSPEAPAGDDPVCGACGHPPHGVNQCPVVVGPGYFEKCGCPGRDVDVEAKEEGK